MSRIELGGEGDPIPTIALPDPNLSQDLPPTVLVLPTGMFNKTDWVGLGFTHYEVWCVGAAGSVGAAATNGVIFTSTIVQSVMSQARWDLWLELKRIQDYFTSGEWDHIYFWTHPSQPGKQMWTAVEMAIAQNPGRLLPITTYTGASLNARQINAYGGAGGGGGVQVAAGVLADLPVETPVVVGVAGVEPPPGQTTVNGLWTPLPQWVGYDFPPGNPYPLGRLYELYNYFNDIQHIYPTGSRTQFAMPTVGNDGGASSFGGDICRASGGKGGRPAKIWDGSAFVRDGGGGAGGVGATVVAGGGGAGTPSDVSASGSDGVWNPNTGIGQGGGGGRSGTPSGTTGFPLFQTIPGIAASSGGRGNFSFADTSIFGDRQLASGILPGGGGGAKMIGGRNYGGRAPTYNPNGLVLIRFTKII